MKKEVLANSFVLLGILAYNFLFWGEKLGLNILIFSTLLVGCLFTLYPESLQSKMARITASGTVFTAIMIVYNNSMFSKVMHFVSFIAMVGFVQQHVLRFFWYALLVVVLNLTVLPMRWGKELAYFARNIKGIYKIKRFLKLAILPVIVLFVFYWIYAFANSAFAKISSDFFITLNDFFFGWFTEISLERILFFISSLFVLSLIIYKNDWKWLGELELSKHFLLQRILAKNRRVILAKANHDNVRRTVVNTIGLKNEYRTASMLLWALNGLLLVVNLTDFRYVWADFSGKSAPELKQFVHEGTYLLIFAILLAMVVILFYFRKNLNFYPKNKWLKTAAYVWILQNALQVLSVGVRNYHYIVYDGLAYKRIGVFIFLILVAIGLVTVFLKVRDKRSAYYLFFTNSWSAYLILVFLTFVNWDVWITQYNLQYFPNDKLYFLVFEVSDKNLWILEENKINENTNEDYISAGLSLKKQNFLDTQSQYSWASWNYTDYLNKQRLK